MNRYVVHQLEKSVFIGLYKKDCSEEFLAELLRLFCDESKKKIDARNFDMAQYYLDIADEINDETCDSVSFTDNMLTEEISAHLRRNGNTDDEMFEILWPGQMGFEVQR